VFHFSGSTWSGNHVVDSATLDRLLSFAAGDLANGMRLAERWYRIQQEFSHHGYLDVNIEAEPQFNDAAGTVSYRVAITEGPQYRMGDLILTGLSIEASDAVRLRWELRPGAIADGIYLNEMLAKLEQPTPQIFGALPVHYAKLGHWFRTDPDRQIVDILLDFQ
jgi:outer membrane protein assembly factor BamA